MRQIYERALARIIWLGDEGIDDCKLAFDLMRHWWELIPKQGSYYLDDMPLETILGPESEENLKSYRALRLILKNEYWNRTWVSRC